MEEKRTRPNVIWLFGDQHRAQALGINGDPNLHTPYLDRMAVVGLNVTGAVSGFPLCCPYRGSLLTSRYPHNCVPAHQAQMPPEHPTIANVFKENGYHTAYFGKWHLDGWQERNGRGAMHIVPPERRGGFDIWQGFENNNSQWDSWIHGGEGDEAFHRRLPGYETDELTNILIDYIKKQSSAQAADAADPFFAVLSVQPPHDPYIAPPEWMQRHNAAGVQLRDNVPDVKWVVDRARRDLAGYYAMIENLDWNLGRVRKALEDAGIADDTHIVFFSDHGDMHGSHGQFRKTTPWQESIGIPFIIGGRRDMYENKLGRVNIPLNHIDVAPTTLGLCGIDAPDWMEGTDYSPYRIRGRQMKDEPDSAYLQCVIPTGHGDSVDRPWRGVLMRDGWKYVELEGQPWLMFNLKDDPYEQVNMAHNSMFGRQRKRLQERVRAWVDSTGDDWKPPK